MMPARTAAGRSGHAAITADRSASTGVAGFTPPCAREGRRVDAGSPASPEVGFGPELLAVLLGV